MGSARLNLCARRGGPFGLQLSARTRSELLGPIADQQLGFRQQLLELRLRITVDVDHKARPPAGCFVWKEQRLDAGVTNQTALLREASVR